MRSRVGHPPIVQWHERSVLGSQRKERTEVRNAPVGCLRYPVCHMSCPGLVSGPTPERWSVNILLCGAALYHIDYPPLAPVSYYYGLPFVEGAGALQDLLISLRPFTDPERLSFWGLCAPRIETLSK